MNKVIFRLTAGVVLLSGVLAFAAAGRCQDDKSAAASPSTEAAPPPEGTYIIGKGDILAIDVWNEPVLSREVIVRIDGMISLPLIDDVPAAGRTLMALKRDIQTRLGEFIEGTEVTVSYKSSQQQKFYMMGEVANPGEYDLLKDLTVLQAFALAGGLTEWADQKHIVLVRRSDGREQRIDLNYKDIVKGKAPLQNFLLQPGDTIIVPY